MRADRYLVAHGHYPSRARAQAAIKAGLVEVDGARVTKASQPIVAPHTVAAGQEHPWVSRGGVKLAHALDSFGLDPAGLVALDVGASTGGFTQVLLERGAARVFAVDVGTDQLHASLRADPRVVSIERTDARALEAGMFSHPIDMVVSDVSFISARLALPRALDIARAGARLVMLVKPQFEAGRENVGRGGLVDDRELPRVTDELVAWLEGLGWVEARTATSPIRGGSGNREGLLTARKLG